MLIGTIGDVRTGKTLLLTKFSTNLANIPENKDKGFSCFSNFHIQDSRVKYITVDDFIDLEMDELNSGLVSLQEFWSWLYSRLSGSEISRGINPIVLQSGKRGFDIDWDSQLASSLDKTVRLLTEKFWVTRKPLKTSDRPYHQETVAFRYVYSTSKLLLRYTLPMKGQLRDNKGKIIKGKEVPIAERYFKLYDTRERADLQYSQGGTQIPQHDRVVQKVKEFTPAEKSELNIEQPFNSSTPQTLIPPKYTKVDTPLLPKNLDEIIAQGRVKTMTLEEPYAQDSHIPETISLSEISEGKKPSTDISSFSKTEKKLSGIEEQVIQE